MSASAAYLERLNWSSDSRNCKADAPAVLYLEDGTEFVLPTTWDVCDVCEGAGHHVDPSIDCGGLSVEEFHDDPDFAEEYFGGSLDVTCARCRGRTTVRVVDMDALTEEQRKLYEQQLDDDAAQRAMERAEYIAGA